VELTIHDPDLIRKLQQPAPITTDDPVVVESSTRDPQLILSVDVQFRCRQATIGKEHVMLPEEVMPLRSPTMTKNLAHSYTNQPFLLKRIRKRKKLKSNIKNRHDDAC